ncbi:hypothetical protein GCM10025771_00250 [Niveibacterium umoris]|uniref:DUF2917 domain-containing protein n=1 Tax=Niveibacterium umoris TaxID=1193620 RepID=A0A840BQF4_9RHOO|nr:DUF2917 domain-containing protein [Niveibacterium umoris]MBB4014914.1 hypothetical protein [Niveibacterium umoris]
MKVNLTHGAIDLAQGKLLSLDAAAGWSLQVSDGSVWVTSPDMPGDHFLHGGTSLKLDGSRRVVVEALQDSHIRLVTRRQRAATPARDATESFSACAA